MGSKNSETDRFMQPSNQSFGIGRRALDIEDYIDIARRHKAWILGPLFAGLVIAVVVAFLWPDTFVSTAVLKVDPQQVPEKYVQSNIPLDMSARVMAMAQEIKSRPVLINVINSFNLYPRDRKNLPMEDVVEEMRKDITISGVGSEIRGSSHFLAFQVSFTYDNRVMAQKICSELVSRLVDANIRTRYNQSFATTDFLKDQYDSAKKQLDEVEGKIAQFRVANQGRLPEQLQANLQQLSAMEGRMNALQNLMSRASQEKIILESRLRSLKDEANSISIPPPAEQQRATSARVNEKLVALDRDIERAEASVSGLKERYTPNHPDVQQAEKALAWLKRQRDDVAKQDRAAQEAATKELAKAPSQSPSNRLLSPAMQKDLRQVQGMIEQTELAIRSKDMEGERSQGELKDLDKQMRVLQVRIEASPLNEPEYQQLLRDRESAKEKYAEMSRKKSQSETSNLIEERKQGENLSLLDPPTLPQTPTYPKRWLIIAGGAAIGLLAGLFLAGAREVKDSSLKNLKDVRAYTQLVVLGSIPLLENDLVVRRRKRVMWLAWSTAVLFGIIVMSGSVYYYYTITKT